jgi:hypothetical protein
VRPVARAECQTRRRDRLGDEVDQVGLALVLGRPRDFFVTDAVRTAAQLVVSVLLGAKCSTTVSRLSSPRYSVLTEYSRRGDRAREIVHNAGGGEVKIHGRDGRIRDSDTVAPGNDPNPPRDKK